MIVRAVATGKTLTVLRGATNSLSHEHGLEAVEEQDDTKRDRSRENKKWLGKEGRHRADMYIDLVCKQGKKEKKLQSSMNVVSRGWE